MIQTASKNSQTDEFVTTLIGYFISLMICKELDWLFHLFTKNSIGTTDRNPNHVRPGMVGLAR